VWTKSRALNTDCAPRARYNAVTAAEAYVNPQLIGEQISLCRAQPLSHCSDHLLESGEMMGFHFGMSCARDHPWQAHCYILDDIGSVLYVTHRPRARLCVAPTAVPERRRWTVSIGRYSHQVGLNVR
jgi:hypothetical protein